MSAKDVLTNIKKYFGILNPDNIITDEEKQIFLTSHENLNANADNNNVCLKTTKSDLLSNSVEDISKLAQRTQVRLFKQELRKQKNLEQILEKTEGMLENVNNDTAGSSYHQNALSEDWLSYYIDGASKISEEQVQNLWAKILAGEIVSPKTYSKRTLDVLLRLSSEEAKLFEKICNYVLEINNLMVLINDKVFMSDYFSYSDVMRLDECGLINSSGMNSINSIINSSNDFGIIYINDIIIGKTEHQENIHLQVFPLTTTGMELFKIIIPNRKYKYIKQIVAYLENEHKNIEWTVCQIIERNGTHTRYVKIDMTELIEKINPET